MPLQKKVKGITCDICKEIIREGQGAWAIADGFINMDEWNGFQRYEGEGWNIVAHTKCFEDKYFK